MEQFAETRSEEAFRALVDEFSGLVFTSALRRTEDREIAEEVTQTVFTILARKAKQLQDHSSLAGWLFTTTKLESSKAMRAKQRHRRKMKALAEEELHPGESSPGPDEENWRDIVPLLDESLDRLSPSERDLLLARYFEERSFKDIASQAGRSEAACKMRVKRTLTKLHRWLGAKGVTLSVTTIGMALSAELTKAAPAAIAASLPAKAMAAGSATGGAAILTNLWNTMNALKTTAATAAAVLALGSVPLILQHSDANELAAQLSSLEQEAADLRSGHGDPGQPGAERKAGRATTALWNNTPVTPVRRLLARATPPQSGEELLETLHSAMLNQDMTALFRTFASLADIGRGELQQLISEVATSTGHEPVKPMTLQMLAELAPEAGADPGSMLDRHLASGVHAMNLKSKMTQWAKHEPAEALTWFRRNRDSGKLYGTGIHNSAEPHLAGALAAGLASTDPDTAMALVNEVDPTSRNTVIEQLAAAFATQGDEGRQRAVDLMAWVEDADARSRVRSNAVRAMAVSNDLEDVRRFVDTMELEAAERSRSLATAVASPRGESTVPERMAWLLEHTEPETHPDGIATAVTRLHWTHAAGVSEWIDALPRGRERDAALGAEAGVLVTSNRRQALDRALLIEDDTTRREATRTVLRYWQMSDPEGASNAASEAGLPLPATRNPR